MERGDYIRAADLFEREACQLGDSDDQGQGEPQRDAWLHVGEMARDHIGDRTVRFWHSKLRIRPAPCPSGSALDSSLWR